MLINMFQERFKILFLIQVARLTHLVHRLFQTNQHASIQLIKLSLTIILTYGVVSATQIMLR